MNNLSAAWLYPIILIAGVLQAWGPHEQRLEEGAGQSVAGQII